MRAGCHSRRLTREEAQALVANSPHAVSPWRVIAVQAAVGVVVALSRRSPLAGWEVAWSALYGAGMVVVPGALMARGMTSRAHQHVARRAAPSASCCGRW